MVVNRKVLKSVLKDVVFFTEHMSGIRLRGYQKELATAVANAIIDEEGGTFVVVFPRQSGKNELQAQIETYLMVVLFKLDTEIVKVSPTWKPQTLNAMRRLERVLKRNLFTHKNWKKEQGYVYRFGNSRIFFLSGSPEANIVGATANTLLSIDEAQDILTGKFDKEIAPMAASTNAVTIFWGTAWTSRTLLAREKRLALEQEKLDGKKRVFILNADQVAKEVPAYGKFVKDQISKMGRNHPMIKTQFFSEEIEAEGGMFPPERMALMRGHHRRLPEPNLGMEYVLTIDVAGEDECIDSNGVGSLIEKGKLGFTEMKNKARDSSACTVFEVNKLTLEDPLIKAPTYQAVNRYVWTGISQTNLYAQVRALIELWRPKYVVIDATGVGAGLASFLQKAFGDRIIPFVFSLKSKSELGWDFLAIIETGRYRDWWQSEEEDQTFWTQLSYCQSQVQEGPGKVLRWGVPDGTRDSINGNLVHDDLVLSAALVAVIDKLDWSVSGPAVVIRGSDPLEDIDQGF